MIGQRALGGLGVVSLSLGAWLAQAQPTPHPIDLRWEGGDGCPSAAEVLAEIDRLLGGRPAAGRRMVVDAQARATPAGWSLDMTVRDDAGEGERQLAGASCAEVASAAALIAALAFDPEAVAAARRLAAGAGGSADLAAGQAMEGGGPALGGGPSAEAPSVPAVPLAVPSQPAPRIPGVPDGYLGPARAAPEPLWFSVAALLAIDLGALPAPAFGIGAALGLRYHPLLVRARGSYFVGVEQTVPSRPSAGGDFDLWLLAPGLCLTPWRSAADGHPESGDLALDLCAEIELGEMRGAGFGVARPDQGSSVWVAPLLGAQGELTLLPWLLLRLGLAVGAPILRSDFVLEQVGIVHTPSPVVGRGNLELGVFF